MSAKKELKRQKKLNLLKQLNVPLNNIIKLIIESRVKDISEKNIIINYPNENKNEFIELQSYDSNIDTNNFEYNLQIIFGEGEEEYLKFTVENWKFKISINPELNELKSEMKKKLLKKFKIFTRSIQSLQCLLPLNTLIHKNFNYNIQAQIYKEKNRILPVLEKDIETEKGIINLEIKEDKCINIKLDVNYITENGIINHKNNIKTKNNSINLNLSQMFEEADQKEIIMSGIVQKKIIEKNEDLNEEDVKEIKKEIQKKDINLENLYSSCFENIENINCQKNIDEILDMDTIMDKENQMLKNVKENFNFEKNNKLIDACYEEMSGIEIKDLIQFPPNNYKGKKIGNYNNGEFENLMDDYFQIKQILNNKNYKHFLNIIKIYK